MAGLGGARAGAERPAGRVGEGGLVLGAHGLLTKGRCCARGRFAARGVVGKAWICGGIGVKSFCAGRIFGFETSARRAGHARNKLSQVIEGVGVGGVWQFSALARGGKIRVPVKV